MQMTIFKCLALAGLGWPWLALAEELEHFSLITLQRKKAEKVSIDNYRFAESDKYMSDFVEKGAFGKFSHERTVSFVNTSSASAPKHGQTVIRQNRDTMYSRLVLDLTVDAVVVFPDMGGRFASLSFHSEAHDTFPSAYEAGRYRMSNSNCSCRGKPPCRATGEGEVCLAFGTKYAVIRGRTLVDPENATDMDAAHESQDAFQIEQESIGTWDPPNWNQTELDETRDLLLELRKPSESSGVFGYFSGPERIDQMHGTLDVAAGFGGVRPEDETYVPWFSPDERQSNWTLTVPQVPVDENGLWSITVYNREGFMFGSPANYNSAVQGPAGLNEDNSTTIHFGGCEDPRRWWKNSTSHCLPIEPGWNILYRIYRSQNLSWVPPDPVRDD